MLVNDILVGLERILDDAGVGLERLDCNNIKYKGLAKLTAQ